MSGWSELKRIGVVVRPFDGPRPAEAERYSPFSAAWSTTVSDLALELRHLNARMVVLELDIQEGDLRLDGFPYAGARFATQAARIAFESKHGALRYGTGEYRSWQDNVRAIALSLNALRAVDRYGVSRSGEQYRGWRQIPMTTGNPEDQIVTREQAQEVIDRNGGTIRQALRKTHPDHGGDEEEFRRVLAARKVLEG